MTRWVVGVALCCVSYSRADDEVPTPKPAPADVSWYGTTPPAPVAEPPPPPPVRKLLREGPFALAGLAQFHGTMFVRVDVGLPISRSRRLRLALETEYRYGNPGVVTEHELALAPALQYGRELPKNLMVVASGGVMWSQLWARQPDQIYWPSRWETSTLYAARFEAAVHYRVANGLLLALPIGVVLPLNTPEPPDARWMLEAPQTELSVAVLCGYQFR